MADVFSDRLQSAYRSIKGQHADLVDVPPERQFSGLDAYRKVLECELGFGDPGHAARVPAAAFRSGGQRR
jgi:hypothetical protein